MSSLAFFAQPVLAHDPPLFVPTRLEFDASRAPKSCNDPKEFRSILNAWVPQSVLRDDAERRLVVRIWSSSTGGKQADVSLVDAQDVSLKARRRSYAAKTECHKVLWEVAGDAAEFLGAFEPPPPKEPVTCPVCPPLPPKEPAPSPLAFRCPTCPPTFRLSPAPSRLFVGIGGLVGSGVISEIGGGPLALLGLVLSPHLPQLHLEFEASWTSQRVQSTRLHSIPLVTSFCWVRNVVRFCGGFATTLLFANQLPNHESRIFGANFRVGTELFNHGPFSIRADVFGRIALTQRTFDPAIDMLDEASPMTGGVAVMGVGSFD